MVRALPEGKAFPPRTPTRRFLAFTPHAGLLRPACSRTRQTPWSVFQDGPLGAAVPASLTALGMEGVRGVRRRTGAGFPAPAHAAGRRGVLPLPSPCGESAGLPLPRPPGRRPARRPATGRGANPSPRPARTPPPCRPESRRWPSRRDGRGNGEGASEACRGALLTRSPAKNLDDPRPTTAGRPGGPEAGGPRALPSRRFQALLTLFSESFSSFPRGTCSLSVSRPCLALGGAYHPLGAAFPSSPTLGASDVRPLRGGIAGAPTSASRTGLSPSAAPRPRGFREAGAWGGPPRR